MKFSISKLATILLVPLTLTACAAGSGSGSDGGGGTSAKTIKFGDKTPEQYFEQFIYRTTGKCTDDYGVKFHFASTELLLPQAADGRTRVAYVDLYIEANGRYDAELAKAVASKQFSGVFEHENREPQKLSGTATLDSDGYLVLEGIGRLRPLTYNGMPAAELLVQNSSLVEGRMPQSPIVKLVNSSSGRDPYEKTCP